MKIGTCTITMAKILDFYVNIKLATEMRISKLMIYREANFCADAFAKAGQEQEAGVHCFELFPTMLAPHLLADRSGVKLPRDVLM
ncbi:hypothetical protein AHAS_Ahas19G0111300 [Arachis hypogaea]